MKPGDTTWMEVKDHYLSDRSNSSNLTFNQDLQRFQYTPNEDYIETELTPEEIEQYQQGGYIVEDISTPELNQAQKGGTKQSSLYIANPKEYAYRKAAYDDSLMLYKNNKEFIEAKEALVKADARLNRNYNKKNVKVFNEAQRLLNNVGMKEHMYHLEREDNPLLKGLVNVPDRPVNTHYAFKNSSGFDRPVQHIYKKKKKVTEPKFERTMVDEVPEVPVTTIPQLPIKPLDSGIPISANEITSLNLGVPKVNQATTIEAEDVSTKMPIYETVPVYGQRPDGTQYIKEYKKVIVGYEPIGGKNYKRVPFNLRPYQTGGVLSKAQLGISDPREYAYRKAAYDDSLYLYNQNLDKFPKKGPWHYYTHNPMSGEKVDKSREARLRPVKHKDSVKVLHGIDKSSYETFARRTQSQSPHYRQYNRTHSERPLPDNFPIKADRREYYYDATAFKNPFTGTTYGVTTPFQDYTKGDTKAKARYKKPVQPVYLVKEGDKDKDKSKSKGNKSKSNSKGKDTGNHVKEKVVTEPEVNIEDVRLPILPPKTIERQYPDEIIQRPSSLYPKQEGDIVPPQSKEIWKTLPDGTRYRIERSVDPRLTKPVKVGFYKRGGNLLTKKVTCKNCGWKWDADDGGNDVTTCHKCGGQGLIHAQKGGMTMGQEVDLTPAQEAHLRKLGYKLERI
jgi:hypothetical protein